MQRSGLLGAVLLRVQSQILELDSHSATGLWQVHSESVTNSTRDASSLAVQLGTFNQPEDDHLGRENVVNRSRAPQREMCEGDRLLEPKSCPSHAKSGATEQRAADGQQSRAAEQRNGAEQSDGAEQRGAEGSKGQGQNRPNKSRAERGA
jgi:hypothetical protein